MIMIFKRMYRFKKYPINTIFFSDILGEQLKTKCTSGKYLDCYHLLKLDEKCKNLKKKQS